MAVTATLVLVIAASVGGAATMQLKLGSSYLNASGGVVTFGGSPQDFTIVDANGQCLLGGDIISLRTSAGTYISADSTGNVTASATSPGPNEKFTIKRYDITPGLMESNKDVSLLSSTNRYICNDSGAVKANCNSPVALLMTHAGYPTAGLTATATAPASPSRSGQSVILRATPSGGPAGVNRYRFRVLNANRTVVIAEGAETTNYSWSWSTPSPAAGTYDLETTVLRYCNDVKVTEATATVDDHKVAGVTFSAPSQSQNVAPGSTLTINWSATNITGGARLYYYNGTTRVADITPVGITVPFETGTYTWTVPSTLAASSQGKVLIQGTANTSMQWESSLFNMSAGATATVSWRWTAVLTPAHFAAIGVTLTPDQATRLSQTKYSIGSIIEGKTNRLYDTASCTSCHSGASNQNAASYQPTIPNGPTIHHRKTRGAADPTKGYQWNNPASTGVVNAFIVSSYPKPDMLEKLFKKWLDEGGAW